MAGRPMPFRNPAGYSGLRENLTALIASIAQFLQSRVRLAAQESKAAGRRVAAIVVCSLLAAGCAMLGSVFLIVFAIVGVARLLHISWIWVALVVALLHFAAALFCLIIARAQVKHPLFRETKSVLREDTEWLKNLDQKRSA